MTDTYHIPVLFQEAIDALNIRADGTYVDCTFGGGGHSKGILQKLGSHGKLFAFDQDADAQQNIPADERLVFIPQNFRYLNKFLRLHHVEKVNGVLADLGVSSFQFNQATRGFSTRFNGPLDMRMDDRQSLTASHIVKTYNEPQLHKLFEMYGEVTNSKTLARHIVEARKANDLKTTEAFMAALKPVVKGNPNKYFAQVFQALRIEVNDELGALKELLQQLPATLQKGGKAVMITFHSLEDRLVKNFFKNGETEVSENENPFETGKKEKQFTVITPKPVTAGNEEIKKNTRSRSAKMRVAEML